MLIRLAHIDDLPAIVDIYNSTIPDGLATADTEPVTIESKIPWFHKHNPDKRPLWVIEQDNQIAGWIGLNDFYGRPAYQGTAEISIYIHEAFRQKGLAQLGLNHTLAKIKSLSVNTILAFVFEHNLPSVHLFKKNQFTEMGRLENVASIGDKKISLLILGIHINQ